MKVLVQKIQKEGELAPRAAVVHLNDGPDSFKLQQGFIVTINIELVQHCLREGFDLNDQEELDFITNGDEPVVANKAFTTVQISLEEEIYTLARIDD